MDESELFNMTQAEMVEATRDKSRLPEPKRELTDEHRDKLSEASLRYWMSNAGKKRRKQMSDSMKGVKHVRN